MKIPYSTIGQAPVLITMCFGIGAIGGVVFGIVGVLWERRGGDCGRTGCPC